MPRQPYSVAVPSTGGRLHPLPFWKGRGLGSGVRTKVRQERKSTYCFSANIRKKCSKPLRSTYDFHTHLDARKLAAITIVASGYGGDMPEDQAYDLLDDIDFYYNKVKCRKIEKLLPVLSKLVIEEQKFLQLIEENFQHIAMELVIFRGFFDMIVAGRRDYALMTEALLVKPV